jgi:hypothetical protein
MEHLNIFDLYKSVNEKKANKKHFFAEVLRKAHSKIKLAAKMDHYACFFEIPEFIVGVPMYSLTECITYVISKLKDNGFVLKYMYPKTIYICWDPKVINKSVVQEDKQLTYENNYDHLLTNKANGKFSLNIED